MRLKSVLAPSLLAVIGGALLVQLPLAIADRSSIYEWFDPIIEIRSILLDDFVDDTDPEVMQQAIIEAMVETVDDQYTVYVPPARTGDFNKQLRGTYVGIGAEVNIRDGYLMIVTPMDGSPALEAGVRAGDLVLEIEGESTFEVSVDECIERLMGEPGTPVDVRVRHLDGEEEDLEITRARIVTPTVKGLRREGEAWVHCVDEDRDVAYVRITQFTASTIHDLRSTLQDLARDGLGGLILDLRDNPGGALTAAVEMSDMFLREGVIVSVRGRDADQDRVFRASSEHTLPDFPMVVLVNGASASASEIVSGALQDNRRAVVVGTRSFGKGSVQEVRDLEYDRGTLKYTTAHYHRPSGRNIQRRSGDTEWGVDPDPGFVISVSDHDYVEKIQARREAEIIRASEAGTPACANPQWIRDTLRDEQLAVAVEAIATNVDTGEWAKVTDEAPSTVALGDDLRRESERRSWLLEQLARSDERLEELEGAAAGVDDRWVLPEDADPIDGTITVTDKDGNVLGTWRIEGGNLELALRGMELEARDGE